MKNKEMVAFNNVVNGLRGKTLPIKLGYAVERNIKLLSPIAEAYNISLNKIREAYVNDADNPKAMEELQELLDMDNDIKLYKVTETEIDKCDLDRYSPLTVEEISIIDEYMIEKE